MTQTRLEPQFLESLAGRIFVTLHRAAESDRCALFVPPFAEEMNRCRPQMAIAARALAENGVSAMIVDPYGTGDSEGDFSDASWSLWKHDIAKAVNWATANGFVVDALIALRFGCSLAVESFADSGFSVQNTVFWQPVDNEDYIEQFLRYGVAASLLKSEGRETTADLKQRLRNGETLEVTGYPLTPEFWLDLQKVQLLEHLGPAFGKLQVLEVGRLAGGELSSAGQHIETAAISRGLRTSSLRMRGEPYWASTEIVVNSDLCRATVQAVVGDQ